MRLAVSAAIIAAMMLCCLSAASLPAQDKQDKPGTVEAIEKHVYLVNVDDKIAQTGFRIHGTRGIVTALHGVIDAKSITVRNNKGEILTRSLTVTKVDIKRDLALLSSEQLEKLDADGLPVAVGIDLKDLVEKRVDVVGYPSGLNLRELWLKGEVSKQGVRELRELLPPNYQKALNKRQSPAPDLKVLHIEGKIHPGHSGAPVLDAEGRVVGVANGGLDKGRLDICWAVPLSDVQWKNAKGHAELATLKTLPVSDVFHVNAVRAGKDAELAILKSAAELAKKEMEAYQAQAQAGKATFEKTQWVSKEGNDLAKEAATAFAAGTTASRVGAEEMVGNHYEAATLKFKEARTQFETAEAKYEKAKDCIEPERFVNVYCYVKTGNDNKELGSWQVRVIQGKTEIFNDSWGRGQNWDNNSEKPDPKDRNKTIDALVKDKEKLVVSSSIVEHPGEVRIDWNIATMTIVLKTNRNREITFERKGFTHKSRGDGGALQTLDIPQK